MYKKVFMSLREYGKWNRTFSFRGTRIMYLQSAHGNTLTRIHMLTLEKCMRFSV